MKEFIEKLIGRLEETDLNDIQMVVRELLRKYGFPYESVVQDEVWDALDELSTNKFAIQIVNQLAEEYNNESAKGDLISKKDVFRMIEKQQDIARGDGGILMSLALLKSDIERISVSYHPKGE